MSTTNTTLGLKLIAPRTELNSWGALNNTNMDTIDTLMKARADSINALELTRSNDTTTIGNSESDVQAIETDCDAYEDRVIAIEAIGEYTCTLSDETQEVEDLESELDILQDELLAIGLGGGFTGTWVYLDGDSVTYTFTFEDGLCKNVVTS